MIRNEKVNTLELLDECNDILKSIVTTIYQTKDTSIFQNLVVSKVAGVGTTAGAFGLASLVGTASTGTAIGTLSGGALTNATLAWIGGSVFTGTIVLAGGALAGGYIATKLYNGKMRDANDIYDYEKEIINACLVLVKSIEEEKTLGSSISLEQLNLLLDNALLPLLIKIYVHTDTISSNLNVKYKLDWNSNRMKLMNNIDNIKAVVNLQERY